MTEAIPVLKVTTMVTSFRQKSETSKKTGAGSLESIYKILV